MAVGQNLAGIYGDLGPDGQERLLPNSLPKSLIGGWPLGRGRLYAFGKGDDRVKLAFVCVGAGRGARYGADKLGRKDRHANGFFVVRSLLSRLCPEAPVVAVVASRSLDFWRNAMAEEFPGAPGLRWERRQDSVRLGVEAAAAEGADVVAIHDAARPLVETSDVRAVVEALGTADGAILVARSRTRSKG